MLRDKDKLKDLRRARGLTQKDLAKKSGVSVHTIMQIEQGTRGGSDDTWEKIERVLI